MSSIPNIIPGLDTSSFLAHTPLKLPANRRRIGDIPTTRQWIYDNVKTAASQLEPVANARHTLSLHDVDYEGQDHFPLKKQKEVLLSGGTLSRRLKGTWRLTDNASGGVVGEKRLTLANVPYLTDRGTYVMDGSEYSLASQLRLMPGIYSRRKSNLELEGHVNVKVGKGPSHRIFLDPQTGIFRIHVGQADIPLNPLLRALGTTDSELRNAWGNELFSSNQRHDSPHYLNRLYERLVKKPDPEAPDENKREALVNAVNAMELDPEVMKRTLGKPYPSMGKDAILATTRKLIALNRGEAEPDNRDDLAHQIVMGPEDLLAERIGKNKAPLYKLLWQSSFKNGVDHIQPGIFNKALKAAFLTSGLGGQPEGVNAAEFIDHASRITKIGEGGLSGGGSAIPSESRDVDPSQVFFIDLSKTPECFDDRTWTLTAEGWKPWAAVTEETEVACLIEGKVEFHKPYVLHVSDYDGLMCSMRSPQINYCVTPNHRVWSALKAGDPYEFRLAEEVHGKSQVIPGVNCTFLASPASHTKYEKKRYIGKVYCATVPGGLLYVRRNSCTGFWSGNSGHVGVDARLAYGVQKGTDGRLYAPFKDPKTNHLVYRSPQQLTDLVVAFPGQMETGKRYVQAIAHGKLQYVPRGKVNLVGASMENAFSPLSNLVPMKSASKAQRGSMGARMITQALPLVGAEAPHVRSAVPGSPQTSFEELYGRHMGAVHADQGGRIVAVTPDEITVKYADGTKKVHDLFNNVPGARKTGLHSTPLVRPGDVVRPGQVMAKSNYTNDKGEAALGLNTHIAYIPHEGGTVYEDSATISESYAKRHTSEHYYTHKADLDAAVKQGKRSFISLFPNKFDRKILDKLDDQGVIKPGTVVNNGDPLVLLAREKEMTYGRVTGAGKPAFGDQSLTWDHHSPGVVTDVVPSKNGVNVVVKSYDPMREGDKLSSRYGGKSVIAKIIPDEHMPMDESGKHVEMLWSPLALMSRINPSWVIEAALGKIAAKTGQPYKIADFERIGNLAEYASNELKKYGMSDTETLTDPVTGRKIPNVLVGNNFIMKLAHQAEGKAQGRGLGGYSAEGTPLRGSEGQAKKMSLADSNALLAHGALNVLQDSREHRSQNIPEFWLAYMGGFPPPQSKVPHVYDKMISEMKGSGINVVREGPRLRLMALTNKDVQTLAGNRELENAETVRFEHGLQPVKGGLMDEKLTGGGAGNQWSKITLAEPLPNPVFAEPIRKLLGLTEKSYLNILSGREEFNGRKGPDAITKALGSINVDKWLEQARADIAGGRKGARDNAVRRLHYLKSLQRTGQKPTDWMMSAVPVLPPMFRPVSTLAGGRAQLISDPNLLYKDLFEANENLKNLSGRVGDVSDERLNLYRSFEAVVGLGDPVTPKNVERGVKGLLRGIFGSGPKWSVMQQKLLGVNVDLAGRAVITPDPDMDMDHIGLPEDKAFDVYRPFIVRSLVRNGMPRTQALKEVEEKSKMARERLVEIMDTRPVMVNRYPLLHRYGLMAFYPKLVKGDVIRMSPITTKPFGADFDGDASQFHVPVSDEAVKDALDKMLPSKNLLAASTLRTPLYTPSMEYAQGLHVASTSDEKNVRRRVFATKADALRAERRGEIGLGTRIEIVGS